MTKEYQKFVRLSCFFYRSVVLQFNEILSGTSPAEYFTLKCLFIGVVNDESLEDCFGFQFICMSCIYLFCVQIKFTGSLLFNIILTVDSEMDYYFTNVHFPIPLPQHPRFDDNLWGRYSFLVVTV